MTSCYMTAPRETAQDGVNKANEIARYKHQSGDEN